MMNKVPAQVDKILMPSTLSSLGAKMKCLPNRSKKKKVQKTFKQRGDINLYLNMPKIIKID